MNQENPQPNPYGQQQPQQQPTQPQPNYAQPPTEQKTNTMAVVGFILAFFLSLVGLILSIVGLMQIKKDPAKYKGKGLAVAGIIIGAIGTVILPLLVFMGSMAYFGVLSPQEFIPNRCVISSGFMCSDHQISASENSISLLLTNYQGTTIELLGIEDSLTEGDCKSPSMLACTGTGCTPTTLPLTIENYNHATVNVICQNNLDAGKVKTDIGIKYKGLDTGLEMQAGVSIYGEAT